MAVSSLVRTLPVLALGVAAVSSSAVLIRLTEAPPLSVAAWRLTGGALVFGAWHLLRTRTAPWAGCSHREGLLLLASAVALAFHFVTWITSLSYTSIVSSVLIVATAPIWVAAGSAWLLKERVRAAVWGGITVAVAGAAGIALSDLGGGSGRGPDPLLGAALALIGAWCVSLYYLLGRRLRRRLATVPYVTAVYGGAALIALLWVGAAGAPLVGFEGRTYLYLALIVLLPQVIGHTAFNWALGHITATLTTVAVLLEPVGAALLAWWILQEVPGMGQIAFGALVLAGVALVARSEGKGAHTPGKSVFPSRAS